MKITAFIISLTLTLLVNSSTSSINVSAYEHVQSSSSLKTPEQAHVQQHLRKSPSSVSLSSSSSSSSSSNLISSSPLTQSRHLSVWASFLHFLRCPPGPLGNRASCKNGGNNNGGGGGGNNNNNNNNGGGGGGGGGNNNNSGWSWSGANGGGGGGDGGGNGGGRNWSNWFTGGSGAYNGGGGGMDGENYNTNVVRVGSFPWFLMVFGLTALATGAGYMAYQTSKNEDGIASAQTLKEKAKASAQKLKTFIKTRGGRRSSTGDDYRLSQDTAIA